MSDKRAFGRTDSPLAYPHYLGYLVGALLTSQLIATPALAESVYIDTIKADIEEFTTGNFKPPAKTTWAPSETAEYDGVGEPSNLADFDTFLKGKLPGTYILYARLPAWKRQQVFDQYKETGDLGSVRYNIMSGRRAAPRSGPAIDHLPNF